MSTEKEVPSQRRLLFWSGVTFVLLVLVGVGIWVSMRQRATTRVIRIATGLRGGTFLPLGQVLAATFAHDTHVPSRALESPGSDASVVMLERHQAELALLSNNTRGGDSIRLIAPLYEETLQIVVRRGAGIQTALDLRGRRVDVGPSGSGTETIAWQVLNHFGLTPSTVQARNMALLDAADALGRGDIDAAFIVAGMRTPIVDQLLRRGDMDLLSLGDTSTPGSALEGIRIDAPYLIVSVIPEHTYGAQPPTPVGTISVKALLVARADLDPDLVASITQSLFANKVRLADRERLLARLSERFDPADSPFPLHPGADRYYRRDDPSFIARNSDLISLFLTIAALLWSGFTALRAARQRSHKSRIETYYAEARKAALDLDAATTREQFVEVRGRLESILSRAFEQLTEEKLDANESFTILQDFLRLELSKADRSVREAEDAPSVAQRAAS